MEAGLAGLTVQAGRPGRLGRIQQTTLWLTKMLETHPNQFGTKSDPHVPKFCPSDQVQGQFVAIIRPLTNPVRRDGLRTPLTNKITVGPL